MSDVKKMQRDYINKQKKKARERDRDFFFVASKNPYAVSVSRGRLADVGTSKNEFVLAEAQKLFLKLFDDMDDKNKTVTSIMYKMIVYYNTIAKNILSADRDTRRTFRQDAVNYLDMWMDWVQSESDGLFARRDFQGEEENRQDKQLEKLVIYIKNQITNDTFLPVTSDFMKNEINIKPPKDMNEFLNDDPEREQEAVNYFLNRAVEGDGHPHANIPAHVPADDLIAPDYYQPPQVPVLPESLVKNSVFLPVRDEAPIPSYNDALVRDFAQKADLLMNQYKNGQKSRDQLFSALDMIANMPKYANVQSRIDIILGVLTREVMDN